MFELKPISRDAIPEALQKVERYRLLNEPWQAESICLDILRIDPDNQPALVMLLLSLTDQFGKGVSAAAAREVLPRIAGQYERAYLLRNHLRALGGIAAAPGRARRGIHGVPIAARSDAALRARRSRCAPPGMTTRFCAGTPAPGF